MSRDVSRGAVSTPDAEEDGVTVSVDALRERLGAKELELRKMLSPSSGAAPRAADVRALRGEITALKGQVREAEAREPTETTEVSQSQTASPRLTMEVVKEAGSFVDDDDEDDEEEMMRQLEELEREKEALMALRALEEENARLKRAREQKLAENVAKQERAQAQVNAAVEPIAVEETVREQDPEQVNRVELKTETPSKVRPPQDMAAVLEQKRAEARARVQAEVKAKIEAARAKAKADAEAKLNEIHEKYSTTSAPSTLQPVSDFKPSSPAEAIAASGNDPASQKLRELLLEEQRLLKEREELQRRTSRAEARERQFQEQFLPKTQESLAEEEPAIDVGSPEALTVEADETANENETDVAAAVELEEKLAAVRAAEAKLEAAAEAEAELEARIQTEPAQSEAQQEDSPVRAAEAKLEAAAEAEAELEVHTEPAQSEAQQEKPLVHETEEELQVENDLYEEMLKTYREAEKIAASSPETAGMWEQALNAASQKLSSFSSLLEAKCPADQSLWSLTPEVPVPGKQLVVTYNPTNRVLQGAKNVTMHYGVNSWNDAQQISMSAKTDGTFTVTVDVSTSAIVMDFVFSDGDVYDNANKLDFHAPVANAQKKFEISRMSSALQAFQDLTTEMLAKVEAERVKKEKRARAKAEAKAKAHEVTLKQREHVLYTVPAQPKAGESVKLYYNPNNTSLSGSKSIYVIGGWNRWSHEKTFKLPMSQVVINGETRMEVEMNVPADAYMMDFVFSNGSDASAQFDNRNNMDYHIAVVGGVDETGAPAKEKPLHVVSVSVEMAPIAKVGGLGDVVTSLGLAVQAEGHRVEVVLPKYDVLKYDLIKDFKEEEGFHWGGCYNHVFSGTVEGCKTYFIDPENGMFNVGMIYGTDYLEIPLTDAERFGYFSRAALEWMLQSGRQPDIIHCHDWQTAPVAKCYWEDYHNYGLSNPRIIFTIHNLDFGQDLIREAMDYSQIGTTVSRTYAQEISGHGSISHQLQKFHGVVNGIDPDIWDPLNDKCLPASFDMSSVAEGKAACRRALCERSNISNKSEVPLIGVVTRLTHQKGIHLIKHAIYKALERGCQVVLLGSAPDPNIQREFEDMANGLKQNHFNDAALHLYFDEPLSHLIYAGADMLLVPSMFEPCGLSQLIAMRYGTVPVVRRTGGLADTVYDYDHDHAKAEWEGMVPNGFQFDGTEAHDIDYALNRAIDLFYNDREKFTQLQANCMSCDFSWNRPAMDYIELYHAARK